MGAFLLVWALVTTRFLNGLRAERVTEKEEAAGSASATDEPAASAQGAASAAGVASGHFDRKDVFDRRKSQFDEDKKSLERLFRILATLVAVAICVALGIAAGGKIEMLGIDVPVDALLILVPTLLLYLWGRLGYLANHMMENRSSLFALLRMEPRVPDDGPSSLDPLLRDHGFIDAYFAVDRQAEFPGVKKVKTGWVPLSVYMLFMAALHAAIFGTLWIAIDLWEGSVREVYAIVFLVVYSLLLTFTHYHFALYRDTRWLQNCVIWVSILLTPAFPLLAELW